MPEEALLSHEGAVELAAPAPAIAETAPYIAISRQWQGSSQVSLLRSALCCSGSTASRCLTYFAVGAATLMAIWGSCMSNAGHWDEADLTQIPLLTANRNACCCPTGFLWDSMKLMLLAQWQFGAAAWKAMRFGVE